jgi:hypothetical protein
VLGDRGAINHITGDTVAGPLTLSDEELKANRANFNGEGIENGWMSFISLGPLIFLK